MMQQSEVAKATSEVLDVLAQKLGATSEVLWSVLVKRATVYGWLDIAVGVLALVAAVPFARMASRGFATKFADCEDVNAQDGLMARRIIGLIGVAVFCVISTVYFYSGAFLVLIPEAGALEYIGSLVK